MAKDDDKDKKIKDEIKKAGNQVEPKDKEALRKIRERTGHSEGNGGKKGKK